MAKVNHYLTKEETFSWQLPGFLLEKEERKSEGEKQKVETFSGLKEEMFSCEGKLLARKRLKEEEVSGQTR